MKINPIAKVLNATLFRNRVKPNKKKYNKKKERQKNVKENSLQKHFQVVVRNDRGIKQALKTMHMRS